MNLDPWVVGIPAALAAASAAAVYGAVHPRSQLFGRTICRTDSGQKLAITFDDGPNPAITPELLDLLEAHNARATFFVIGRFARECPDLVRETIARGHLVANHTYTHPNLALSSPSRILSELRQCSSVVAEISGAQPAWFRPPYGFRNPWVVSAARSLGMRTVMWTLIPGDWRPKPVDWLVERMSPIAARSHNIGGDILCLHDGGHRGLNADRTHTIAALRHWLPRWRDLGLQFVTIEQAVRTPAF